MSADGRFLAYSDPRGLVHLVDVAARRDRVIGRGAGPRFSPDGRLVAFIGSASAPAPGGREWLAVYRVATAHLTRLGPAVIMRAGLSDPASLFAWSPRGERFAWLRPSASSHTFILSVALLGGAKFVVATATVTGIDSGPAWSAAGDSVFYWHAAPLPAHTAPVLAYSLLNWRAPDGPTRVVIPSTRTAWFEGIAPAPVASPRGTAIASLLGAPRGGLDQVLLYRPGRRSQAIHLPGEPTAVRFAPAGTWFVAIWTRLQGNGLTSHAGLIDPVRTRVNELGSALGAIWLRSSPPL